MQIIPEWQQTIPDGLADAVEAAGIALARIGGVWHASDADGARAIAAAFVAPPAPVPATISLRQLLLGLVAGGWITQAEALDAARTGAVPGVLATLVEQMPEADAFAVRLTWAAMYEVYRTDPLWAVVVGAGIATAEQVDDLFRGAVTV